MRTLKITIGNKIGKSMNFDDFELNYEKYYEHFTHKDNYLFYAIIEYKIYDHIIKIIMNDLLCCCYRLDVHFACNEHLL